ncbi:MAG TPA: hypothetical protein VFF73_00545, partial [Planctomycetota bacterium]|nr:hypothetical protein [Planctomycetota bacterium]
MNPLGRRARWSLVLAIVFGAGLAGTAGVVLYPRYLAAKRRRESFALHRRRKLIKLYMQEHPPAPLSDDELVADADDASSMVLLTERAVNECEHAASPGSAKPWRRAFELWALEPEPRDPRPLDHLVELS